MSTNSPTHNSQLDPKLAFLMAGIVLLIMGVTMISFGWVPHLSLILAICFLLLMGLLRGLSFDHMQSEMAAGVVSGSGAIYLFFFIGLMVAALMMSGAIPTLMYFGFELISPRFYYISAFVLTSIIGIALGSSLTTVATLGVAFIGMSNAFDANVAIAAGAVVSGAFFGDKMSPLSDTGTIASSVVGIDLFEHLRNMMYTTVPAWVISVLLFWMLSGQTHAGNLYQVTVLQGQLIESGLVHSYAVLPFAVLVILALLRVNAIYTIICTIISALIITYMHSSPSIAELGSYFFAGYTPAENLDLGEVGGMLTRGGIQSMFFTQTIVILALSLGGLLKTLGILPALLEGMRDKLTTAGQAIFAAAMSALSINVLIGEQYLSILLSGTAFRPTFERLSLHPKNLSRTIEDAGTVINPLVPWSVCGVFISQALEVPVLEYLPYAFFCYLSLLLTILFGFSGITISRLDKQS
ncbi:Na+/H+ antiporter NhaC [Psychrobacter phenylpyruvicus]|uniref:Sodium/proton antiporter n=2 Tax=Psychrobacter phenylpyruvicus TaxID=29432 RepID=A0A379LPS8_9GAMM|nr:Na+/H+ antiporter NhaC [Psychrobacter phenylpyruvicus]SUD91812.1 Sodium/proton antiporter [Psychrobacter phenylpyruvicus]SUD98911.1 Sodium/proton antiporter [Psychrobacter phenylpyruvicus]